MDGVLVNSTDLHTVAWERYLAGLGVSANGLMARMLGKRNDQIVHDIFGADLPHEQVLEHGFAKERLYRELMAPVLDKHLVPGVVEFVRDAAAAGIPLALGTNAEPLNVEFILDGAGIRSCFSAIVDGHQVAHAKPDPEVYLTASSRLGMEPANCVVFEDSPGGMKAALTAGARLVALLTTLKEAPQAGVAVPDFLDPSLANWLSHQRPV